jgi:hypothetical protein
MLGFQTFSTGRIILSGIEMIHMMRKQQAKYACSRRPSLAGQFDLLAARAHHEAPTPFSSLPRICDGTAIYPLGRPLSKAPELVTSRRSESILHFVLLSYTRVKSIT